MEKEIDLPEYYNNSNGSLYLFAEERGLNSWESDIIKRVVRCRKKGSFREDLEKTKNLIDLYIREFESKEEKQEPKKEEYYYLKDGDEVKEGDEYNDYDLDEGWAKIDEIKKSYNHNSRYHYKTRRRINK
tara:strand:+ start:8685 stop:9074 length:390 start_codon:yes stop_codon:yes gene_type:complete